MDISSFTYAIQSCAETCEDFPYYGLKDGDECWCGDYTSSIDRYGESEDCDVPCTGDSSANCGGDSAMRVFTQGKRERLYCLPQEYLPDVHWMLCSTANDAMYRRDIDRTDMIYLSSMLSFLRLLTSTAVALFLSSLKTLHSYNRRRCHRVLWGLL